MKSAKSFIDYNRILDLIDIKIEIKSLLNSIYYFYLIWSIIRFSLVDNVHNVFYIVPYIRWFTFVIDPLIICIFFIIIGFSDIFSKKLKWLNLSISIYLTLFLLSTIANLNLIDWTNYGKFIIGYLRFIPFIYFSILIFRINNIDILFKKCLKTIKVLLLIQAGINLMWFLGIFILNNPKIKLPNNPDWGYGLMENTHIFAMSYVILIAIGFYGIRYSEDKSKRELALNIVLVLIGLVQLVWAESKVNFITILLSIGFVSFLISKYLIDVKVLIAGLIAFFTLITIYQSVFINTSHLQGNNYSYFYSVFERTLQYNFKIRYMQDLINKVPDELDYPVLGAGPGVLASKFALDNPTLLSEKYFLKYDNLNLLNGNSILLTPRTGLTAIYGDLGVLSFILYFSLHGLIFLKVLLNYRKSGYSGIQKVIAYVWLCFSMNYFFHTFFQDILYIGFHIFFFWSFGTFLVLIAINKSLKATKGN